MLSERPSSRYEVLLPIASGGMATVFVGRVRGTSGWENLVAIKRSHGFVATDDALKKQLEHEAHVASLLHHPNVVSVLDVERIDDELVLVMDYVEGCALKDLLDHANEHGIDTASVAVRVILDVAAGLEAAHRLRDSNGKLLGVVHRDVSPHNVLLGVDGVARLADFGIAKIASSPREETMQNVLKGKLAYLPPEYVEGRTFDDKSDLYSLGVMAWEALAQQRLFKGTTTTETLRRITSTSPPKLGSIRAALAPMEDIVARATARFPSDRPESVEAFARELEECASSAKTLATHAEVGALVDRASGSKLRERRRRIVDAEPHPLPDVTILEHAMANPRE